MQLDFEVGVKFGLSLALGLQFCDADLELGIRYSVTFLANVPVFWKRASV